VTKNSYGLNKNNWLPWQRPLKERKITRLFIHEQISTNPANFVKIGLVDVEIIGLKEITKRYIKTRAKHIAHLRLLEAGWAK